MSTSASAPRPLARAPTTPISPLRYPTLHPSEDPLILELGARFLRAGFSTELHPRCLLRWTSTLLRPAGTLPPTPPTPHTLLPLTPTDPSLIADHLERALRDAYHTHLLLDSKTKKLLIPLQPLFPLPLLSSLLKMIFDGFMPPAITIVSAPVMATIAAGLRAALIVDIGWWETIVTPVCELRAIPPRGLTGRSRRAVQALAHSWQALLQAHSDTPVSPADAEEAMERLGWCRHSATPDIMTDVEVPLNGKTLRIPFAELARPVEETFWAADATADDEETPLARLVYNALLHCAVDVRAACVSRIVVVGGGARVPGLQRRLQEEVAEIVRVEKWEGSNWWKRGKRGNDPSTPAAEEAPRVEETAEEAPRAEETAEEVKLGGRAEGEGEVRCVQSLGVWAGASIIAGLKTKGKVEVEREKFLAAVANGGLGLPAGLL